MSNQDWMSLTEIARLWSLETGESADLIERDLNAWFSEFVVGRPSRVSGSPHDDGVAINRLMGLLGGRQLKREIFGELIDAWTNAKWTEYCWRAVQATEVVLR